MCLTLNLWFRATGFLSCGTFGGRDLLKKVSHWRKALRLDSPPLPICFLYCRCNMTGHFRSTCHAFSSMMNHIPSYESQNEPLVKEQGKQPIYFLNAAMVADVQSLGRF